MQYYAPSDNVPSLQWGHVHEDDARQHYVSMLQGQHCNLQISPSGLIIDTGIPFMGASPDGFCSCDCCGERIIEIKCPYSIKNSLLLLTVHWPIHVIVLKEMIMVKIHSPQNMHITHRLRHSYSLAIRKNVTSYVGHLMVSFLKLLMKIVSYKMKSLANARIFLSHTYFLRFWLSALKMEVHLFVMNKSTVIVGEVRRALW